ncbi:DUF554 family protein [Clostridium sp. UBA7503]|uniref:DUF554 family protein n=1 Tax=Clostridium sp. UBA7503 TaxID=1946377 RepID=UPI0039C8B154
MRFKYILEIVKQCKDKNASIAEMTCIGSLLISALDLNMMKISKFEVMNYLLEIF